MSQEFYEQKISIINRMTDYMKFGGAENESDPDYDPDFDSGYAQEEINQCGKLLDLFLTSLEKVPETSKNEYVLDVVKKVVLGLNKLNEDCDYSLIETGQREDLCELIITASKKAGLESNEEDVTEEWREW
jgi:hypothetical protein